MKNCERREAVNIQQEADAARIREWFVARVSPERLASLDKGRECLPKSGEYSAGYWRERLSEEAFEIAPCCAPIIAELHEAERLFYFREMSGDWKRLPRAREAWARHQFYDHGQGWAAHVIEAGCWSCRNTAKFLHMALCEESAGFGLPRRLDDAHRTMAKHAAWHRREQAKPVQEALGVEGATL